MSIGIAGIQWRNSIDSLGRKRDADFLTELLQGRFSRATKSTGHPDSLVLNLNAPWGTGKTFLMDNWAADLEESGWTVLRFNAWAHDFAADPLLNFIASIEGQVSANQHSGKRAAAAARELSQSLTKDLAPAIAKTVFNAGVNLLVPGLGQIFDPSTVSEAAEKASDAVENAAKALLDREKAIEKRLGDFKQSLSKFAREATPEKPLLLLIDELDRCRPNFAIDLLEVLKHVFAVPGVYTVIATDTTQLSHSARHAYGSNFQSDDYLKRFFDLQYQLSTPDRQSFALHVLNQQGLDTDSGLICPVEGLFQKRKQSESRVTYKPVFVEPSPEAKSLATRAMIVAAVADRLSLQNREVIRLVELIRAVADSFASSTKNSDPAPKLHLIYLTLVAGAYIKDRTAVESDFALSTLYERTQPTSQHKSLASGYDHKRQVSSFLTEFTQDLTSLRKQEYEGDVFGSAVAASIHTDPASALHLVRYRMMVQRCGQLVQD